MKVKSKLNQCPSVGQNPELGSNHKLISDHWPGPQCPQQQFISSWVQEGHAFEGSSGTWAAGLGETRGAVYTGRARSSVQSLNSPLIPL